MSDALRKILAARETTDNTVTVPVGILSLHFQLYGVDDPGAKRRVFAPMRKLWGKEPDLAVAETGDVDALDSAIWSIVAIGGSAQQITARLDQIEKAIAQRIDAPVLEVHRELL